jgi:hypothetical protein
MIRWLYQRFPRFFRYPLKALSSDDHGVFLHWVWLPRTLWNTIPLFCRLLWAHRRDAHTHLQWARGWIGIQRISLATGIHPFAWVPSLEHARQALHHLSIRDAIVLVPQKAGCDGWVFCDGRPLAQLYVSGNVLTAVDLNRIMEPIGQTQRHWTHFPPVYGIKTLHASRYTIQLQEPLQWLDAMDSSVLASHRKLIGTVSWKEQAQGMLAALEWCSLLMLLYAMIHAGCLSGHDPIPLRQQMHPNSKHSQCLTSLFHEFHNIFQTPIQKLVIHQDANGVDVSATICLRSLLPDERTLRHAIETRRWSVIVEPDHRTLRLTIPRIIKQ